MCVLLWKNIKRVKEKIGTKFLPDYLREYIEIKQRSGYLIEQYYDTILS